MERLTNYDFTLDIEWILNVSGGDQRFEVLFFSKTDRRKYKLIFDHVVDMRYSIENGYIERFHQFRKNLPLGIKENSIYVVENSKYTEFFIEQCSHTRDGISLTDYIVCDEIDTVLEILSSDAPVLIKL